MQDSELASVNFYCMEAPYTADIQYAERYAVQTRKRTDPLSSFVVLRAFVRRFAFLETLCCFHYRVSFALGGVSEQPIFV